MKKDRVTEKHIKWLKNNLGLTFEVIVNMTDEETDALLNKLFDYERDALKAKSEDSDTICEIKDIIFDEDPHAIKVDGLKVRYIGESDPFDLLNGKIYDVLSVEYQYYRIVGETGDEYLYEAEVFDIVNIKPGESYICPGCGMHTFWSAGEHEVCPICNWEDMDLPTGVHETIQLIEKNNAIHALMFLDANLLEFVKQETGFDRSAIEKMSNNEFAYLYNKIADIELEATLLEDSNLSSRGKNAKEFITIVRDMVYSIDYDDE